MTAFDEPECAFTLTYPALTYEEDPDTINVHEATVNRGLRSQDILQVGRNPADQGRGDLGAPEKGHFMEVAQTHQRPWCFKTFGDNEAGHSGGTQLVQTLVSQILIEGFEKGELSGSQDLDPLSVKLVKVACKGQTGFLDTRDPDGPVHTLFTGKDLEVEILIHVFVKVADRNADHPSRRSVSAAGPPLRWCCRGCSGHRSRAGLGDTRGS